MVKLVGTVGERTKNRKKGLLLLVLHGALVGRGVALQGGLVVAEHGEMDFAENDVVAHVGDFLHGFFY